MKKSRREILFFILENYLFKTFSLSFATAKHDTIEIINQKQKKSIHFQVQSSVDDQKRKIARSDENFHFHFSFSFRLRLKILGEDDVNFESSENRLKKVALN
jgi:hypothetical protein